MIKGDVFRITHNALESWWVEQQEGKKTTDRRPLPDKSPNKLISSTEVPTPLPTAWKCRSRRSPTAPPGSMNGSWPSTARRSDLHRGLHTFRSLLLWNGMSGKFSKVTQGSVNKRNAAPICLWLFIHPDEMGEISWGRRRYTKLHESDVSPFSRSLKLGAAPLDQAG